MSRTYELNTPEAGATATDAAAVFGPVFAALKEATKKAIQGKAERGRDELQHLVNLAAWEQTLPEVDEAGNTPADARRELCNEMVRMKYTTSSVADRACTEVGHLLTGGNGKPAGIVLEDVDGDVDVEATMAALKERKIESRGALRKEFQKARTVNPKKRTQEFEKFGRNEAAKVSRNHNAELRKMLGAIATGWNAAQADRKRKHETLAQVFEIAGADIQKAAKKAAE